MARVIAQSRQWIASKVSAPGEPLSLAGLQIEAAIFQLAPPTEEQWHPAEWDPDLLTRVRLLIGPGTDTGQLAPGRWKMRIRLIDYPEFPHLDCGRFTVIS